MDEQVVVGGGSPDRPSMTGRLVLAALILAALAVALFLGGGSPTATGTDGGDGSVPTLGSSDAPVVVVNYSDFQCSFCRRFTLEVEPQLIAEYVDTGQVRMEWRDFPVLGEDSVRAAIAGRAAHEQGAFWPYHGLLYAQQDAGFSTERLVAAADELGLDVARFRQDLASEAHRQAVQADFTSGQELGLTGTPSFLINGQLVVGAQPIEVFRETIDQALSQATGA